MKRLDLIAAIRIAGAALTASLALVLASVSFLALFLGVPELDPARKVVLSALCMIGPMTFAWASMEADQVSQHDNLHAEDNQHEIATDIRKAA